MRYIVKGVRQGKTQEFAYDRYDSAIEMAIEMKDSGEYSVITILERSEDGQYFLKRIVK